MGIQIQHLRLERMRAVGNTQVQVPLPQKKILTAHTHTHTHSSFALNDITILFDYKTFPRGDGPHLDVLQY